jgi:hypothetical protein
MRIQPTTGNVGIGTTNPIHKLDINGGGSSTFLRVARDTGSILLGAGLSFSTIQARNNLDVARNLFIDAANVGIGTDSPATRLDVNGAITASGGFFNSDLRLKDLTDYDYNVLDIKPISYLWKDGRDNKKHVGYSAQDVQKVMPDAVNEGTDGMLSVNYVEVLVAKIAELENKIKQLEKLCLGTI